MARHGKAPVLEPSEARHLLDAIDITTVIGLRDRALIWPMVYSFARVGAAIRMQVEDVYTQNQRWLSSSIYDDYRMSSMPWGSGKLRIANPIVFGD